MAKIDVDAPRSAKCAALCASLHEVAQLPLDRARAMPSALYTDPEFAALERETIFRKEWICIGRADQLPKSGDYLTDTVDGQPVIAIRQKDDRIRVFSNTCLHRYSTLAAGAGHLSGPLVCPYHAWSYDMSGTLRATPYAPIQHSPACKSGEMRLREFATETWGGFLFVSLAADPKPLAPQLVGLEAHLPGVALDRYRETRIHDETWNVDWKMLTENFIESYHIFMVHRTTLEPLNPTRNAVMVDGGDAYAIHFTPYVEDAGPSLAHPDKKSVPEGGRRLDFDFLVFPSFMCAGSHNRLWWMSLQPQGVGKVKIRWGGSTTPEVLADPAFAGCVDRLDQFIALANDEDKAGLERVQAGVAGPLPQLGWLTPLEQPLWEFIRYLDRRMNSPMAGREHDRARRLTQAVA